MALSDVITSLGTAIINLVSNTVQGIADYLINNSDIPESSTDVATFVKNTEVPELNTKNKTIVGAINEIKEDRPDLTRTNALLETTVSLISNLDTSGMTNADGLIQAVETLTNAVNALRGQTETNSENS